MVPVLVHQNADFVCIDKPAGWLAVPGRFKDERPIVGLWLEETLKCRVFPVHRLDYEVSGLMLFALNAASHKAANSWFEGHQVAKTYEALSQGQVAVEPAIWETKIVRGKKRSFEAAYGKQAVTHASVQKSELEGYTLWDLKPQTGRPHQLRFEMFKHGHPVWGDALYGDNSANWKLENAIALRAVELDFSKINSSFGLPSNLRVPGLTAWLTQHGALQ